MRADAVQLRLTRGVTLTERVEPESGDPEDLSFLRRPALLGLLAVVSICVGASLPSSPFKLEMGGTWFFGEADWPSTTLMLPGVVAVYGGMILFVRVWYGLFQTLRARGGVPIRPLAYMLALWILPLLAVAPLFSKDVFSYAAQGEMMSRHINPYHYGPGTLGSGPYVSGVDPLWANTPAPYGPLFLMLAGWSASLTFHHALLTIELLRLQSVAGIALIAYCIPKLARSFGRDPGPAFVLAVLNPLTLLALVGGAHNDAIMVGLLLAGVTAARSFHPVWGIVLCALAASIKVPAAIGIVYVAWDWAGPFADWRRMLPGPGAGRPGHGGRHGGALPRLGPRLGLDRQPGHPRHGAVLDGARHGLRAPDQRDGPRHRHRRRPGRGADADPRHRADRGGRHRRLLPAQPASASACWERSGPP